MEEHSAKRIKLETAERPLNFAISPDEYETQSMKKTKLPRDPMSHRIIEKRRRDRMNNCLAELSRLIPPSYLKQGQGRIEKTEIIEMASKLIRNLQNLHTFRGMIERELPPDGGGTNACCQEKFFMGFKECQEEVLQYLIETEGVDPKHSFCQRVSSHLDQTSKKFLKLSTVKAATDPKDVKSGEAGYSVINSTQGNGSTFQGMNISENSMVMINQDEHLRTLLQPKEQGSSQTSGYCSSSGMSLSDTVSSSSCITLQSVQRDSEEKEALFGSGGSQCSSEQNSTERGDKDCRKCHVYKFKHNITKRFSEEGNPCRFKNSDTSSNDSREEDPDQSKQKILSYRTDSPGTDSTRYPASENSSGSNSSSGKRKMPKYEKLNEGCSEGRYDFKQVPLPAFVLHPMGTHYVPVTVHPSHFRSLFKDNKKGSMAYHPISIPVNFCGPSISIHTQVEENLLSPTSNQDEEQS